MRKVYILTIMFVLIILASCSKSSSPTPTLTPTAQNVSVIEYPSFDWSLNNQQLWDAECVGDLPETCKELIALGCDHIKGSRFYLGGLQPPYAVMECIHEGDEPPDPAYFRQQPGLDTRYRSYAVNQEGKYRLIINKSEFKAIFAPVESTLEAISYAMAMTALSARFDIDPDADVDYLVNVIEETHAEETADGYLVHLFDWDHQMGCDTHSFYAVQILITRDGEVSEVERQEIYRGYSCFDFGTVMLEEN